MFAKQDTGQKGVRHYRRSITLHNDVQEVPLLNAFVDEVCKNMGFDVTLTMKMNLAIEEAVVNVMNYAYAEGTTGEVYIEANADDACLEFVIRDSGVPFDPTSNTVVDTTLPAEVRPIGGLGIFLVKQLMDTVHYKRHDGQNILTLQKKMNRQ